MHDLHTLDHCVALRMLGTLCGNQDASSPIIPAQQQLAFPSKSRKDLTIKTSSKRSQQQRQHQPAAQLDPLTAGKWPRNLAGGWGPGPSIETQEPATPWATGPEFFHVHPAGETEKYVSSWCLFWAWNTLVSNAWES